MTFNLSGNDRSEFEIAHVPDAPDDRRGGGGAKATRSKSAEPVTNALRQSAIHCSLYREMWVYGSPEVVFV